MGENTRKDEVISRLTDGIARLTTSERWHDWLTVQSQFHQYSFNNTLLIQLQCSTASRVAGFQAWRKLGRNVRKGEKGIWILAPMTRKVSNDDDAVVDDKARVLMGFKPVPVFDIAQTDGEPLPESCCTLLDGDDVTGMYGQLVAVAQSIGYSVEDAEFTDSRNGDCTFSERRIRVRSENAPLQRVKTLAHELAHAMLHEHSTDRALAELEAESVAYVVCANIGVNSDEYSFGYVANWSGGGDEAIAAIKASGSRIQHAADDILGRLEKSVEVAA